MQSACGFSVESFKAAHWSNAEGFSFHFRNFRASDAWYFDLIFSLRVEQPSAFTTPLALTLPRHHALALCIARYHYLCQFYHSQYTQRWEQNPSAKGVNFHIQYFQCSTITADIIWNIPCLYIAIWLGWALPGSWPAGPGLVEVWAGSCRGAGGTWSDVRVPAHNAASELFAEKKLVFFIGFFSGDTEFFPQSTGFFSRSNLIRPAIPPCPACQPAQPAPLPCQIALPAHEIQPRWCGAS